MSTAGGRGSKLYAAWPSSSHGDDAAIGAWGRSELELRRTAALNKVVVVLQVSTSRVGGRPCPSSVAWCPKWLRRDEPAVQTCGNGCGAGTCGSCLPASAWSRTPCAGGRRCAKSTNCGTSACGSRRRLRQQQRRRQQQPRLPRRQHRAGCRRQAARATTASAATRPSTPWGDGTVGTSRPTRPRCV